MRKDRQDLAQDTDPLLLQLRGLIRRMAVTLTSKVLWQVAGFRQADGTTETRQVEVFPGIGFFARPPSSGSPEAIVTMVGGATAPAVVATRDEKTRAAVAGSLQPDESMVYTSQVAAHATAAGEFHVRAASGVAADAMVRGTTYRSAEDVFFTAIGALVTALGAYATGIKATADPTNASTPALLTAVGNFATALATFQAAAATYLSQIGKVQ